MTTQNFGPLLSDEHYEDGTDALMIPPRDWRALITSPMEENCLAPSDEAIGLGFDLYCDEREAPFRVSEAEMADLYADIVGGIAELQIIAPDILDEILSPDPEERH